MANKFEGTVPNDPRDAEQHEREALDKAAEQTREFDKSIEGMSLEELKAARAKGGLAPEAEELLDHLIARREQGSEQGNE
jgi:hypothetical protein